MAEAGATLEPLDLVDRRITVSVRWAELRSRPRLRMPTDVVYLHDICLGVAERAHEEKCDAFASPHMNHATSTIAQKRGDSDP